jgi:hypothetical protein
LNAPRISEAALRAAGSTAVPALWRELVLAAFVYYVLFNSKELHDVLPATAKHGAFIVMALVGIAARTRQALKMCLLASPIATIYFLGDVAVYGAMVLVFAAALPVLSAVVVDAVAHRRQRYFVVLVAAAFVPALLSLPELASEGLFDITYGRERVLLGYWHPKEAGICFGIPALLMIMSLRRHAVLLAALACLGIALVGSRNVALLLIVGTLLRFYPRLSLIFAGGVVISALAFLLLNPQWLDALDTLMSLRLTVWADALSDPAAAAGLDVLDGERFAVDSFFIEAYIYAQDLALPLVLLWLMAMVAIARRAGPLAPWPTVAVVVLLMFAALDSGVASTGNLMHALLWSIAVSPLLRPQRGGARRAAPLIQPLLLNSR